MRRIPLYSAALILLLAAACGGANENSDLFDDSFAPAVNAGGGSGGFGVGGSPNFGGAYMAGAFNDAGRSSGTGGAAGRASGGAATGGTGTAGAATGGRGVAGSPAGGPSAGGSSGTAGAATAGTAGTNNVAGMAGSAGSGTTETCAQLLAQIRTRLRQAQNCSTMMGRLPCQDVVPTECGCQVPVDNVNSQASQNYLDMLLDYQSRCQVACIDIVCREPVNPQCQTMGMGMGQCVIPAAGFGG